LLFSQNILDGPRSNKLKLAMVKRVPRHICREHKVMVREKCQKCAGGLKGNACVGDSGGPLVLQVRKRSLKLQRNLFLLSCQIKDKLSFLVGVVSFGTYDCGSFPTPSVFSDLHCYIDWIIDTIKP